MSDEKQTPAAQALAATPDAMRGCDFTQLDYGPAFIVFSRYSGDAKLYLRMTDTLSTVLASFRVDVDDDGTMEASADAAFATLRASLRSIDPEWRAMVERCGAFLDALSDVRSALGLGEDDADLLMERAYGLVAERDTLRAQVATLTAERDAARREGWDACRLAVAGEVREMLGDAKDARRAERLRGMDADAEDAQVAAFSLVFDVIAASTPPEAPCT